MYSDGLGSSLTNEASSERKNGSFGNDLFNLLNQMRMTREKKYLVRAAQVANGLERRSASAGIEIDEDVVKDDR
jgi:hypothetical protein